MIQGPIRIGDEVNFLSHERSVSYFVRDNPFSHKGRFISRPGPPLVVQLGAGHNKNCKCGQCQQGKVSAILPDTKEIDVIDHRGHQWRMKW